MPVPVHFAATGCLTALGDLDATMAALTGASDATAGIRPGPEWAPGDLRFAMVKEDVSDYSRHRTFGLALALLRRAAGEGTDIDPDGLAVIFATTTSGMLLGEVAIEQHVRGKSPDVPDDVLMCHLAHRPAEAVATALVATGPWLTVSTACTSGTVAFGVAMDLLRAGRCRRALVIGADALCRTTVYGFRSLGACSPARCRPFDEARDGMMIGEGAAFALLEPGEGAIELLGCASRTDAHHLTAPDPQGRGLVRAMLAALGNVDRGAIDHVNAHATGTVTNDGVEAGALAEAAPAAWVSATKGATGHTLGAAGVLEAVILAESMRRGVVPASVGCERPVGGVAVAEVSRPRSQRIGVSVNMAFGGHNAAIVLRSNAGPVSMGRL